VAGPGLLDCGQDGVPAAGGVDRPAHLLGLPVPALRLDHDRQDRLAGLLIGEHDDHVREVLGRRDLAHVRGAKRTGDPGRQPELRQHAAQEVGHHVGLLTDDLEGRFMF
jgi:hypothetical protein